MKRNQSKKAEKTGLDDEDMKAKEKTKKKGKTTKKGTKKKQTK